MNLANRELFKLDLRKRSKWVTPHCIIPKCCFTKPEIFVMLVDQLFRDAEFRLFDKSGKILLNCIWKLIFEKFVVTVK